MMSKKSKKAIVETPSNSAQSSNPAETSRSENLRKSSSSEPSTHWSSKSSTTVSIYEMLCQLKDRIDTLEIQVGEMQAVAKDANSKEKVAALETKVKDLQESLRNNPLKEKCDFSNPKTPIRKSCAVCSKTFLKNADLEKHMNKRHGASRDFECTVCGKKFFLEWRLKKHAQMHTVIPRTCRYFSSKMPCPFEEIGCKFLHTTPLQPATFLVDAHGHEEQPQPQQYHEAGALHGREEQPQPQLFHDVHRHADQSQHYYAALHGLSLIHI